MSGDEQQPWWEADPGRLECELAHLREHGEIAREEDGRRLRVKLPLLFKGREVELTVEFPPCYPYAPPSLFAEPGLLERHQNPETGNLCVVGNLEHWWRPQYVAAILVQELKGLLDAAANGDVAEGELDIPEPLTGYFPPTRGEAVVVLGEMLGHQLSRDRGTFELATIGGDESRRIVMRIQGVRTETVALSSGFDARLSVDRAGRRSVAKGSWKAITPDPGPNDFQQIRRRLIELAAENRRPSRGRKRKPQTQWSAVTFLEEGPRRGELRRAWVFARFDVNRQGQLEGGHFMRTQVLDEGAMRDRARELTGVENACVTVIGAGALGGHAILQLARAGVGRIEIIDHDQFDLNNSVRHVLTADAAGLSKAKAVAELARRANPFIQVSHHEFWLGSIDTDGRLLSELVEVSDVVVDTTGSHVVTRITHRETSLAGKPLVSAALSVGGYGGRVVVLRGPSPCFDCFLEHPQIPRPEEGPSEGWTPYGCSHPAASCAGFDVAELAAITARTIVHATERTDYAHLNYDWAVVNFRSSQDRWREGSLEPFRGCRWCGGNG